MELDVFTTDFFGTDFGGSSSFCGSVPKASEMFVLMLINTPSFYANSWSNMSF